ncbi:hypothetical protein, partial [Phocaeicola vulgatus]|uniref:hypothetical protein n=1 Tax=Phocaeicola vulgatus TaxID=821 RepID=UPI001E2FDCCA
MKYFSIILFVAFLVSIPGFVLIDCDGLKIWKQYLWTLSKILCKWKQDSAVSLFLYLDSVF